MGIRLGQWPILQTPNNEYFAAEEVSAFAVRQPVVIGAIRKDRVVPLAPCSRRTSSKGEVNVAGHIVSRTAKVTPTPAIASARTVGITADPMVGTRVLAGSVTLCYPQGRRARGYAVTSTLARVRPTILEGGVDLVSSVYTEGPAAPAIMAGGSRGHEEASAPVSVSSAAETRTAVAWGALA